MQGYDSAHELLQVLSHVDGRVTRKRQKATNVLYGAGSSPAQVLVIRM